MHHSVYSTLKKTKTYETMTQHYAKDKKQINIHETRETWKSCLKDAIIDDSLHQDIQLDSATIKQIELDVNRSFTHVKIKKEREEYMLILQRLICSVLQKNCNLNYYQGFHDVSSVFIILFTDLKHGSLPELQISFEDLVRMLYNFCLLYLRDFMMPDLRFSMDHLKLIPSIFKELNIEIYHTLFQDISNNIVISTPISSILTLFSHDVTNINVVIKIFSLVIEQKSLLYVSFIYCLIIHNSQKTLLKTLEATREACLNENDTINVTLQNTFYTTLEKINWDSILADAKEIPNSLVLPNPYVNKYSVLRNAELFSTKKKNFPYKLSLLEFTLQKETELNAKFNNKITAGDKTNFVVKSIRLSIVLGISALVIAYIVETK